MIGDFSLYESRREEGLLVGVNTQAANYPTPKKKYFWSFWQFEKYF